MVSVSNLKCRIVILYFNIRVQQVFELKLRSQRGNSDISFNLTKIRVICLQFDKDSR